MSCGWVPLVKIGSKLAQNRGPIGEKGPKTRNIKNAAYVANECKIANAMKPGVANHAKGGYHAALSNARIS